MGYNDIVLNGLIGSNPLGALAAFGLLRVCSEIPSMKGTGLYWSRDLEGIPIDDWIAILRVPDDIDKSKLIELLSDRQKNRRLCVFEWSDDIRTKPENYREYLEKLAEVATQDYRLCADYATAFASEIIVDKSQGLIKPTAFHMTSGKQKFLKIVKDFGESMLNGSSRAFEEALFGPWLYQEKLHSLGWDPSTERAYAYRHKDPSKKTNDDFPRSVLGAIWLAIEALPLFPTAVSRGRLKTTCFIRIDRNTMLIWPIWEKPLGLDSLRSLLMTSELVSGNKSWDALGRRGVSSVYQSMRSELNKGYAIFRPASIAWCK
jgi:hypothetical protein